LVDPVDGAVEPPSGRVVESPRLHCFDAACVPQDWGGPVPA
jgi:hypothetical protein